jgi:hypothetical protein
MEDGPLVFVGAGLSVPVGTAATGVGVEILEPDGDVQETAIHARSRTVMNILFFICTLCLLNELVQLCTRDG